MNNYFKVCRHSSLVMALLCLNLISCATHPKLSATELEEIKTPIYCKDKNECDSKWSKAQSWIVSNSRWKIRVATDTIIQTEGPFDTMNLAFTANKIINNDGSGKIGLSAGCGNIFGCDPAPELALKDFRNFLNN